MVSSEERRSFIPRNYLSIPKPPNYIENLPYRHYALSIIVFTFTLLSLIQKKKVLTSFML